VQDDQPSLFELRPGKPGLFIKIVAPLHLKMVAVRKHPE